MSTTTMKERMKFISDVSVTAKALSTKQSISLEEMQAVAKKMNVASAYKIQNLMGELASRVSVNIRKLNATAIEAIGVMGDTNFNGGEFTTLINAAREIVEENTPQSVEYVAVSESADGNEDLSKATIESLNELLKKYSLMSRSALLEVSDAASLVKGDDNVLIINLGKGFENITNDVITMNNRVMEQVEAMSAEYNLTLASIEDISAGLSGKLEMSATPDISTGSMDV